MDRRRRQYAAVDVIYPFKTTAGRLHDELGPAGPLAFLYLILAAKRAPIQGEIIVASEVEFWRELGFHEPPDFTMEAFLKLLGQLKQTSRTPVGRALNIKITRFEDWQELPRRFHAAERSARKREQKARDDSGTTGELSGDYMRTETRRDEPIASRNVNGDDESPPTDSAESSAAGYHTPQDFIANRDNNNLPPGQLAAAIITTWPNLTDDDIATLIAKAGALSRRDPEDDDPEPQPADPTKENQEATA